MKLWHSANKTLWQGRDDSAESPEAKRLFQTVEVESYFAPEKHQGKIALLGFACDEGVKRNQGRPGAQLGPDALRKALANMASHSGHDLLVDLGNVQADPDKLEEAQQALHEAVEACQRAQMKTLVLGGGHETAYGHGAGVLDAFPNEKVVIVNLDAHLDLRSAALATSGTPFRQLALKCESDGREFSYTCYGASKAANTQALWQEAQERRVTVLEDLTLLDPQSDELARDLKRVIDEHDRIYLTIDLDVLPAAEMPAVSAPAALGVPLAILLRIVLPLCQSGKLQAVDLVEFNPHYDRDGQGARTAARLAWQIMHSWHLPQ
ncbi:MULTISPECIES: formimidoylglutamase [Enterobacterales]|uniref:formimidoylglutamase n=1 Tax=Enterobacterales TaxID=91347 RepID=UPI002ED9177E